MSPLILAIIALAYVTLLFAVAHRADQRSLFAGALRPRPLIYSLSLAIYCTSWTFFGSIGVAADQGLEFLAIYIGPILVFTLGYPFLRRMVMLGKSERSTSIADFLAARYGKSFSVAIVATLIAAVGVVPYIALQLKAISSSFSLITAQAALKTGAILPVVATDNDALAFIVAMLLALFAILFGTRHADATEHQDGLVYSIALESVVKLVMFLAVGMVIIFGFTGMPDTLSGFTALTESARRPFTTDTELSQWIVLILLSACAILVLPRQFHITVVESRDGSELRAAAWMFPLYLVLINIFVAPIAAVGIVELGRSAPPDLYLIAIPLVRGDTAVAIMAFIGGLSAATAMVVVASVAMAIMISNHIVLPLIFSQAQPFAPQGSRDWRRIILKTRRIAIVLILVAGFLFFKLAPPSSRLASIGLLSFAALAQLAPALVIGMFWRGANARGAVLGMLSGFATWTGLLLVPALSTDTQQIFALAGYDAFASGVVVSLVLNVLGLFVGSWSRQATPFERLQASVFVPRTASSGPGISLPIGHKGVTVGEMRRTLTDYLGAAVADRALANFKMQENVGPMPETAPATPKLVRYAEQQLGTAVGSSSARLILSLLVERERVRSSSTVQLLDEASVALQQNRGLLQTALEQMRQGIAVFDRDLKLTFWNDRFFALLQLPDAMRHPGLSIGDVVENLKPELGVDDRAARDFLNRLAQPGLPWRQDFAARKTTIEIHTSQLPDGGLVTSYSDVSDLVRAADELRRAKERLEERVNERTTELVTANAALAVARKQAEQANLSKTRFLAAAGHDILQPLNAARLYASSLGEVNDDGKRKDIVRNIASSLDSVESILEAVLDMSRLDTGAMRPRLKTVSLNDVLRSVETDFRPLALERGVALKVMPCRLSVETDPDLIRRLVQNLVSNAIKYSPQGRVLLGVRRREGLAHITVVDTGIGIADQDRTRAFAEFSRLEAGARQSSGLGLGLSIVQRIAGVLNADLSLKSQPGRGTEVSVALPVVKGEDSIAAPAKAIAPGRHGQLDGMHVICIDNEPTILNGMAMLLGGWGCSVTTLTSSADAEALLGKSTDESVQPHLILADYHLIGETGLDVIDLLRRRTNRAIPACLVTADRSAELRNRAQDLDVDVLNKPIKPAALRALLNQYKPDLLAAE